MEELYGAVAAVPLNRLLGEAGAIIFCLGIALVLLVFTFGINASEIIQQFMEKLEERKEEKMIAREEAHKQRMEEAIETPAQRRKRERKEKPRKQK